LFDALEHTAVTYEVANSSTKISIRVAGGWVRDHLLQTSSNDIDFCIASLSVVEFATLLLEYLSISESKHLETATFTNLGLEVDVCPLRGNNTYSSTSRILTVDTNATPYDETMRRDFTINTLFDNIRTKQIHDSMGREVHNLLIAKQLQTPLDPHITFRDDPLRILWSVRVVIRYNFTLSDAIVSASKDTTIQELLQRKVSRERIGRHIGWYKCEATSCFIKITRIEFVQHCLHPTS